MHSTDFYNLILKSLYKFLENVERISKRTSSPEELLRYVQSCFHEYPYNQFEDYWECYKGKLSRWGGMIDEEREDEKHLMIANSLEGMGKLRSEFFFNLNEEHVAQRYRKILYDQRRGTIAVGAHPRDLMLLASCATYVANYMPALEGILYLITDDTSFQTVAKSMVNKEKMNNFKILSSREFIAKKL